MKAYFAVGDGSTGARLLAGHRALISFAYIGTSWLPEKHVSTMSRNCMDIMVDSGAFTAWKQGSSVSLDAYVDFLHCTDIKYSTAIVLDVIGDASASIANWRNMVPRTKGIRLMPVWHEGDPYEHLDEYVRSAPVVGLGRIGARRSEPKTFAFYDDAFNRHPSAPFHALGNANPTTLEPYPFESFDSTGWQRDASYSNAAKWPFNRCTKDTRMMAYIEATETISHEKQQPNLFSLLREVAK